MDHSGGDREFPLKGSWAAAAAQKVGTPTTPIALSRPKEKRCPTPQLLALIDNSGVNHAQVLASEHATLPIPLPSSSTYKSEDIPRAEDPHTIPCSPLKDNQGDSLDSPPAASPTSPTDNPGDDLREWRDPSALPRPASNKVREPSTPPLTLTDHSGGYRASHSKGTRAEAAGQQVEVKVWTLSTRRTEE